MGAIKTGWDFFQNQILGMHWLKDLTGTLLRAAGVSMDRFPGEFIQFFIYDTIKIFVLLGVLIFIISYIQSYFPPERSKKIMGRFHYWCTAGNCDPVLFLLLNSDFYGIYQCRSAAWGDVFFLDFISDGGFGFIGITHECIWRKNCTCLCHCGVDYCSCRWNID